VAEDFKAADVIGVFVRENHAIELLRRYATLLQSQHHLARAETAINEKFAVIGCNQRTVSRAPAAEHGQAEHGSEDSGLISDYANEIVTRKILSGNVSMRAICCAAAGIDNQLAWPWRSGSESTP
jgi:hypothetical protein